ncbi:MAG: hypothetical protein RMJ54_19245, partial [Roseiflexaceae bacterium]|nr:hypothetical protein [Roseiflexaceae bacterium]
MRLRALNARQIALLLAVVNFLGGIATDIAVDLIPDLIPEWLRPHLWLAWPLAVIFLLLALALTALEQRERPDLARQRALLLGKVQAEIKRQLENRLPE